MPIFLEGSSVHGANFIETVLDAIASAILTDEEGQLILEGSKIDALVVKKMLVSFSQSGLSFLWKSKETIVAITGTNGKTSVAILQTTLE